MSRRGAIIVAIFTWLIGVPLVHGVVPWLLSHLAVRHGWTPGPGLLNALGVLPVASGAAIMAWVMVHGFRHAGEMPDRVEINWDPKLLLTGGPYAFSRNPMYVAEVVAWLGWALFYGSIPVLVGALVLAVVTHRAAAREERALEERFGEPYRRYRSTVPRWLGSQRPG